MKKVALEILISLLSVLVIVVISLCSCYFLSLCLCAFSHLGLSTDGLFTDCFVGREAFGAGGLDVGT